MNIFKYPLGELQANCYLLVKDKKCIIIDPGDNADFLLEKIARENIELEAMLATHGHFDHIMGAGNIQTAIDAPLLINERDDFLVKRLKETAQHFLRYEPVIIMPKTEPLKEGNFQFSIFNFQIISTPGHTLGSSCFYLSTEAPPAGRAGSAKAGFVFTGDTLFKDAIGVYDHSYSDKAKLLNSVKKLLELPDETVIYPGHGDISTVAGVRSLIYPL